MDSLDIPWFGEASRRKKWLLGVSGGMDSMALLHLMHEAGFSKVVVCHLNHDLRGKESDGDARFVKRAAERCGFSYEGKKVDLRALMAGYGESLETAGRHARHEFFAECSRKERCGSLLLAHHAGDQAETVLWNLIRGSSGCRGMEQAREMEFSGKRVQVIRPLLSVRKSDLREWMESRRLKWREDASNEVNDVVRNQIRNEVLPLLDKIAKRDVAPLLARAAKAGSAGRELAAWALEKADVYDPQGRLHLKVLRQLPPSLQTEAIKDLLQRSGVSGIDFSLLERCTGMLDVSASASTNLPGGGRLRRRAGRIFVELG